MDFKKGMAVAIAAAMICTAMAGCSAKKPVGEITEPPANTSTTAAGQSTTAAGEVISAADQSTTKKGETTTANSSTTASSTTQTTKKVVTTLVNKNGTTRAYQVENGTSAPYTTTKPTTTKKIVTTIVNNNGTTKPYQVDNGTSAPYTTTKPTTQGSAGKTTAATTKPTTKPAPKPTTKPATTSKTDNAIKIVLTKNGGVDCNNPNVSIGKSGVQGVLYIEKGGDYLITSNTNEWHGQIVIKLANTEKADIRFENVNITTTLPNAIKILDTNITAERSFIEADVSSGGTSGDTDNALQDQMEEVAKIDKAPNVDLSFPTGTKSTFKTSANVMSGVIYNESKLTIKGNGAVNLTSTNNRNNTISSTKSITFKNVAATLTTPGYGSTSSLGSARGIYSFSKVYVESGMLTIHSNGDGIRCEGFNATGGTTSIHSSACDGIDADNSIIISGGKVTSKALEKSAFKVRRVNNQENLNKGKTVKEKDCITKAAHTFKIDGGTVIGEGKNMTVPKKRAGIQQLSTQPSIYCRSVKSANAAAEDAKMPLTFTIKCGGSTVATSSSMCYKFLYSSPSLSTSKTYTVKGHNKKDYGDENTKAIFTDGNGKVGDCRVVAS